MGSIPVSVKKHRHPGWGACAFGAGYGNRTRLHGLGSRCITDIRTLRDGGIITGVDGKCKGILSERYGSDRCAWADVVIGPYGTTDKRGKPSSCICHSERGAPRSESEINMLAGGKHTAIQR